MALGFHRYYALNDCPSALRYYHAGAVSSMSLVDNLFHGDFISLRPLTMTLDSLGDSISEKMARDVETLSYWTFKSDRKDPQAFFELGKIYQLGLNGVRRDVEKESEYYESGRRTASSSIAAN